MYDIHAMYEQLISSKSSGGQLLDMGLRNVEDDQNDGWQLVENVIKRCLDCLTVSQVTGRQQQQPQLSVLLPGRSMTMEVVG